MSDSLSIALAVFALTVVGLATTDLVSLRRCPACSRSTLVRANKLLCARCRHPVLSHLLSEDRHSTSAMLKRVGRRKTRGVTNPKVEDTHWDRSFSGPDHCGADDE